MPENSTTYNGIVYDVDIWHADVEGTLWFFTNGTSPVGNSPLMRMSVADTLRSLAEVLSAWGPLVPRPGVVMRGTDLHKGITYDRNHGYADRSGTVWYFGTMLSSNDGTFLMYSELEPKPQTLARVVEAGGPLAVASVNGVHRQTSGWEFIH